MTTYYIVVRCDLNALGGTPIFVSKSENRAKKHAELKVRLLGHIYHYYVTEVRQ